MDAAKSIEASSIGKLPIRKLNNQKIKNYLTTIVGYSQSNIDKLYSALTQAFAVAFELNVINENPFLKNTLLLQKPKSRKKPKEIHAFDNETTERFLKCIYEYVPKANCFDYSKQCIISLLLGLRMGEVNGLKPEDVDFDNELLHIERTVSKDLNYKPVLDNNPKTYKSKRVIPLNPQVAIILKEAIKNMRKNEDGLIFYNWKSCRPFSTKEVNDFFTDFCNKNGIKSDGCHMLRHTYASNSIQNNVNPFMLRELMGHESIDITLGTYAKFFDKNKKDAVNNYNTYINDLLAKIK
jgi:integrase